MAIKVTISVTPLHTKLVLMRVHRSVTACLEELQSDRGPSAIGAGFDIIFISGKQGISKSTSDTPF